MNVSYIKETVEKDLSVFVTEEIMVVKDILKRLENTDKLEGIFKDGVNYKKNIKSQLIFLDRVEDEDIYIYNETDGNCYIDLVFSKKEENLIILDVFNKKMKGFV